MKLENFQPSQQMQRLSYCGHEMHHAEIESVEIYAEPLVVFSQRKSFIVSKRD